MSEECSHDCSSCGQECGDRSEPQSLLAQSNPDSHVKKVIGVVSGKGGVGKSMVTSLLASAMQKKGYNVAILDADITGPSIPRMFGLGGQKPTGTPNGLTPATAKNGTKVMSVNLLLPNETDPVVWRGPIIANTVTQFWTDVCWGDVDYMFVDMPPGTGDVPLTVFQSLPVDGIIVVSSPQQLVRVIVEKAVNMANMMNIPILGIVENMSYVKCPDCGKEITVFGKSNIDKIAESFKLPVLARLPMDENTSRAVDAGDVESIEMPELEEAAKKIESMC